MSSKRGERTRVSYLKMTESPRLQSSWMRRTHDLATWMRAHIRRFIALSKSFQSKEGHSLITTLWNSTVCKPAKVGEIATSRQVQHSIRCRENLIQSSNLYLCWATNTKHQMKDENLPTESTKSKPKTSWQSKNKGEHLDQLSMFLETQGVVAHHHSLRSCENFRGTL